MIKYVTEMANETVSTLLIAPSSSQAVLKSILDELKSI